MDKNNKVYALYFVICVVIVYLGYNFYQFATYLEEQGECGMAVGPIYGNKLEISNLNLKIEQYFEFPKGKIGFSNLFDTNPPKIIKFTKDGQIIWGYEFLENDFIGIPFYKMSNMKMKKLSDGFVFEFFNHSFSEPGKIYLDNNLNLKYMCLEPF